MLKKPRTLFLLLALLIPAVALAQTPAATPPSHDAQPDAQKKKTTTAVGSAVKKDEQPRRYETVRFESKLVGAALPYNVLLPADYKHAASKAKRYPVIYLLHGLGGSAPTLERRDEERDLVERCARVSKLADLLDDQLEYAARSCALEEANRACKLRTGRRLVDEQEPLHVGEGRVAVLPRACVELVDAAVGKRR